MYLSGTIRCSAIDTLPGRASGVTPGCEALGTTPGREASLKARWASDAGQAQTRIVKGVVRGHRVHYGALSRLERCAVKVARTVLRGRGGGNATPLPDISETELGGFGD